MKVSVLMPMRNAARTVGDAARSVLAERRIALELIVIDDSDDERSAAVVRRIADKRVRVICGSGRGIAATFNLGLDAAQGDIVMRCDADDLYPPGRIAWQVAWLEGNPLFGAVAGRFGVMDAAGRPVGDLVEEQAAGEITEELRQGVTRTHFGAWGVRTGVLRAMGGCREFFVTAEDVDLALRLGEACRVWYEPRVAYHYRVHQASITHRQPSLERAFYEGAARRFARQRHDEGRDDLELGRPPSPPSGGSRMERSGKPAVAPTSARRQIQDILIGRAWRERQCGDRAARRRALATHLRACAVCPGRPAGWRSLAALMVKRG